MRGNYIIVLEIPKDIRIEHEKRSYVLRNGYYVYVGSALGPHENSIENRIKRHLSKDKKIFWHIDKVTTVRCVRIIGAFFISSERSLECEISLKINKVEGMEVPIPSFGSTDCSKGCPAHFYYYNGSLKNLMRELRSILDLMVSNGLLKDGAWVWRPSGHMMKNVTKRC
ncbi:MAG: GIY-YIG nuclease family protein [Candidatus Asgardarchaeia archaeon]